MAEEEAWSAETEGLLVELWQVRPCLYNISSPEYSDRSKKAAAMGEIAGQINMSGTNFEGFIFYCLYRP